MSADDNPWSVEDPRMLREQIRIADLAANRTRDEREALIFFLKGSADGAADDMEGAGLAEFSHAEGRMVFACEVLKHLGINYDPMSGEEKPL